MRNHPRKECLFCGSHNPASASECVVCGRTDLTSVKDRGGVKRSLTLPASLGATLRTRKPRT